MRSRIAAAYLGLLFAPFGMFSLAWAFIYFVHAQYPSGFVALGFGLFSLGFVAMLVIISLRKVTPRVMHDRAGTTLRPDPKVDGLLMAATIAVFVAMALYAVFAPQGMIVIPVSSANQRHLVIACIIGLLVGLPSMWHILRQRGMSRLRMTVDEIQVGSAVSTKSRTWDEVTDVADRPRKGRHSSGTTYLVTDDGHSRTLPSDWYTPGGQALREWVRFYWQHPEAREELTDGRAAQRLEVECRGTT